MSGGWVVGECAVSECECDCECECECECECASVSARLANGVSREWWVGGGGDGGDGGDDGGGRAWNLSPSEMYQWEVVPSGPPLGRFSREFCR